MPLRVLTTSPLPSHGKSSSSSDLELFLLLNENTFITIRLYKGELKSDPIPSLEIVEVRYFDSMIAQKHLTPASEKIFAWLKERDYID